MIRRSLPFYRSNVTRWAFILTGTYLAVSLSPWGPAEWRDTPSLRWLHTVVPFPVMVAAFAAYVAMHLLGSLRIVVLADYLGLALYGIGLVALLVTVRLDRPTNPLAIAAVALACVLHYMAGKLAVNDKEAT